MNRGYIETLDHEGLQHKLHELNQRGALHQVWARVASSENGEALLKEQRKRVDMIRGCYKDLPVNSEFSAQFLAGIQGKEQEAIELLRILENALEAKKSLDEEAAFVVECMKNKKDKDDTSGGSIVAPSRFLER